MSNHRTPLRGQPLRRERVASPSVLVWRRAGRGPEPNTRSEHLAAAIELTRLARHDPALLRSVSRLGRDRARRRPGDIGAQRAARTLAAACDFLGVPS